MHTSFLAHARARYLWVASTIAFICLALYAWHDPLQPPNGGTWLGYGLGTLGLVIILVLSYLGRRKRDFKGGSGSVKGWVSAHVYLGIALLLIGTIHTGFQFAWNVHTLAYGLMCAVIATGLYGIVVYETFPARRNKLTNGLSLDELFLKLEDIDRQLLLLANHTEADVRALVVSAVERTTVGGGMLDQLLALDHSTAFVDGRIVGNRQQLPVLDLLIARLTETDTNLVQLTTIIRSFTERRKLLHTIRTDIQLQAFLKIWLYLHVPLTFALLAALIAHTFAVFVYW